MIEVVVVVVVVLAMGELCFIYIRMHVLIFPCQWN